MVINQYILDKMHAPGEFTFMSFISTFLCFKQFSTIKISQRLTLNLQIAILRTIFPIYSITPVKCSENGNCRNLKLAQYPFRFPWWLLGDRQNHLDLCVEKRSQTDNSIASVCDLPIPPSDTSSIGTSTSIAFVISCYKPNILLSLLRPYRNNRKRDGMGLSTNIYVIIISVAQLRFI